MAKAIDQSTSRSAEQLDIVDALDTETDLARAIEAATQGLECANEGQRDGILALVRLHIERLESISARLYEPPEE